MMKGVNIKLFRLEIEMWKYRERVSKGPEINCRAIFGFRRCLNIGQQFVIGNGG